MNEELQIVGGCVESGAGRILKPELNCRVSTGLASRVEARSSKSHRQNGQGAGQDFLNGSLLLKRALIINMKNVCEAQHLEVLNQVHCLGLCIFNFLLLLKCSVKLRYSLVIVLLSVFKPCGYRLITSSDQSWRFWRKQNEFSKAEVPVSLMYEKQQQ